MKVFISFTPRQHPGNLAAVVYHPQDNDKLLYGETRFPIIPVIHGYAEDGEEIRMLLMVEDYDNCRRNADAFRQEFEALCQKKGLRCAGVEILDVPFDDSVSSHIAAFQALIDKLQDGDELHACITYGSKPSPMVELMALRYARQLKKNTYISCIVYGQIDHQTGTAKIYDETALAKLDDVMCVLIDGKIPNPEHALRHILDL